MSPFVKIWGPYVLLRDLPTFLLRSRCSHSVFQKHCLQNHLQILQKKEPSEGAPTCHPTCPLRSCYVPATDWKRRFPRFWRGKKTSIFAPYVLLRDLPTFCYVHVAPIVFAKTATRKEVTPPRVDLAEQNKKQNRSTYKEEEDRRKRKKDEGREAPQPPGNR